MHCSLHTWHPLHYGLVYFWCPGRMQPTPSSRGCWTVHCCVQTNTCYILDISVPPFGSYCYTARGGLSHRHRQHGEKCGKVWTCRCGDKLTGRPTDMHATSQCSVPLLGWCNYTIWEKLVLQSEWIKIIYYQEFTNCSGGQKRPKFSSVNKLVTTKKIKVHANIPLMQGGLTSREQIWTHLIQSTGPLMSKPSLISVGIFDIYNDVGFYFF